MEETNKDVLARKVFIVTGGTRGLGADLTKALVTHNATVIALYKGNVEAANKLKQWANENNISNLEIRRLDITDRTACAAFADDMREKYGTINGLVNNAAVMVRSTIHNLSKEDIYYSLDNNVVGLINITQALWGMLTAQEGSAVINISSVASRTGKPSELLYAMTKGAVEALTRALAREAGAHQVSVNAIAPHAMNGGMGKGSMDADPSMLARIPLNRPGEANELTNLTLFLLSGASPYLTGQVIHLNGGRAMMG